MKSQNPVNEKAASTRLSLVRLIFCFVAALISVTQADVIELDEAGENDNLPYRGLPTLRVLADYGPSLLIKSIDSGYTSDGEKFFKDSFLGTNLYLEVTFYPWARGGIGLFFAQFISEVTAHSLLLEPQQTVPISLKSDNRFTTFGPMFSTRVKLGHALILGGVGAGYYRWRQNWWVDGEKFLHESDTYAVVTQVGADMPLLRALSLGINARLWLSSVRKFKENGKVVRSGEDENVIYYNSLNRLEVTAGLRFGL